MIKELISFIRNKFKKVEPLILTEWYPADIKPMRHGVYQVKTFRFSEDIYMYAYWDGVEWCHEWDIDLPMFFQEREWRGLANEPK